MYKNIRKYISGILIGFALITGVYSYTQSNTNQSIVSIEGIPSYDGSPSIVLENNHPVFGGIDTTNVSGIHLSALDTLGRAGRAYGLLDKESLYFGERESIGMIKPSGWHTVRYDDLIEDKWLFNRCHLIANVFYQDGNVIENLITGTRYMNVEGMLPYEIEISEYIQSTGNHVLYCVTPIYEGNNLVASGVTIEAMSYEDQGNTLSLYVYCYNIQPGIQIDYATGESRRIE